MNDYFWIGFHSWAYSPEDYEDIWYEDPDDFDFRNYNPYNDDENNWYEDPDDFNFQR